MLIAAAASERTATEYDQLLDRAGSS